MNSKQDVQTFIQFVNESKDDLELIIQQPDVYKDEMKNMYAKHGFQDSYEQIHNFFTRVDQNHTDLLDNKSQGYSTESWFHQKIEVYNIEQPDFLPEFLKNVEHEMQIKPEESLPLNGANQQSDIIESKSIVRSLFELIKLSTNVNIVSSGNDQKNIPNILGSEVRAVQDAIKARIGDPSDVPVKEFITLAMLKCQDKSSDSNFQSFSVSQIASVVDSSYSIFKVGYHLANGSVKASDMTEYLIDRSAARVEALIHNGCIRFGKKAGAAVGRMVGSKLGPAGAKVGNFVGAAIGGMVGEKISNMISIGIQKVVPVAKEKINRFFEKAESKLSSLKSNVMSWVGL